MSRTRSEYPLTLMAVHAHPDDEVFSTGGALSAYSRQGVRTVVVYCTGGEEGELHGDLTEADRPNLGKIREAEARAACHILGVEHVEFLGYRDSGMKDTEANANPSNFMNAPLQEASDRLLGIMARYAPQVVITYNEDGGYGHPDHVMTHNVTVEAFRRAQGHEWHPQKLYFGARSREGFRRYVETLRSVGLAIPWMKDEFDFDQYGTPNDELTAIINVAELAPLKKAALAAHRSQITPDFFYLSIPDDVFGRAQDEEFFMRSIPPAAAGEHESDLFAGLRDADAAA